MPTPTLILCVRKAVQKWRHLSPSKNENKRCQRACTSKFNEERRHVLHPVLPSCLIVLKFQVRIFRHYFFRGVKYRC